MLGTELTSSVAPGGICSCKGSITFAPNAISYVYPSSFYTKLSSGSATGLTTGTLATVVIAIPITSTSIIGMLTQIFVLPNSIPYAKQSYVVYNNAMGTLVVTDVPNSPSFGNTYSITTYGPGANNGTYATTNGCITLVISLDISGSTFSGATSGVFTWSFTQL
jgi:hypothetical protein